MASMFQGQVQVSAAQVGSYFVGQYYQILQQQPQLAFQFYTDASTLMRIDGASIETAVGTMQIDSLIMTLNYAGIEIITAHSLNSWHGGVLVMVSGLVEIKGYGGRRKFVQNFFLAPQEKGYFVLTDIFYFLDEEPIHQPTAAILAHSNYESSLNASNQVAEPVSRYVLGEEIQASNYVEPVHVHEDEIPAIDYAAPVHAFEDEVQARDYVSPVNTEEDNTVDKYSIPELQQQSSEPDDRVEEIPTEEPIVTYQSSMNIVRDPPPAPAEEPAGERPKQTYASILRLARGQPSNPVPQAASFSKPITVSPDAPVATTQHSYPALSTRPEKSSSEALEDVTTIEDEGDGKSVYVGNLPSSVSAPDLEHEFKDFGRIRPDGVTVRSRKDSGGFYAFVEFEDVNGVQNALKASPILLNGRQIYVEERKPNSGIFRGGRRGRGRGGFVSDSSRGRFGGRSFARGGMNDSGDRLRGNGVLRGPRQERGILGSHGMRNGHSFSEAAS